MLLRPPRLTRPDPPFPYPTLFRSHAEGRRGPFGRNRKRQSQQRQGEHRGDLHHAMVEIGNACAAELLRLAYVATRPHQFRNRQFPVAAAPAAERLYLWEVDRQVVRLE